MALIEKPKEKGWLKFPEMPELEIVWENPPLSTTQKKGVLIGFFAAGLIAMGSIYYQQPWLKTLRPFIVLSGTIAGFKLLSDMTTPSKLEQEKKRLEEEKRGWRDNQLKEQQRMIDEAMEQLRFHRQRVDQYEEQCRRRDAEFTERLRLFEERCRKREENLKQREDVISQREKDVSAIADAKIAKATENFKKQAELMKADFENQFDTMKAGLESQIALREQKIQRLEQQLYEANYPIPPKGERSIDQRCKLIQRVFWREGIVLDCNREEPMCDLEREIFLLYPKDSKFYYPVCHSKEKDKFISQIEGLFNNSGSITIEQKDAAIRIIYNPKGESLAEKEKK